MLHQITIKKINKETADAVSISLDIPANLQNEFAYKPGQYLTFETTINGELVRRAYSLCSSPYTDADPAIAVKKVNKGKMSTFLNEVVKEGDSIAVLAPNGKFLVDIDANASNHYVLFGGGSGITPLMSILKSVLTQEPNSNVTLIYANKSKDDVIFNKELDEMAKKESQRFKLFYSYDNAPMMWFGLKGMLNIDKVGQILNSRIGGSYMNCKFYICGPTGMMDVVKKGLLANGVQGDNIHTEYFTAPTSGDAKAEETAVADDFKGYGNVTLHLYGKTHQIEMDDKTTILDAANHEGLQPPYSCTIGVCTTCRAKVIKGTVHMIEREGLSDAEIADGYILTCQSQIRSNDVELKYE